MMWSWDKSWQSNFLQKFNKDKLAFKVHFFVGKYFFNEISINVFRQKIFTYVIICFTWLCLILIDSEKLLSWLKVSLLFQYVFIDDSLFLLRVRLLQVLVKIILVNCLKIDIKGCCFLFTSLFLFYVLLACFIGVFNFIKFSFSLGLHLHNITKGRR